MDSYRPSADEALVARVVAVFRNDKAAPRAISNFEDGETATREERDETQRQAVLSEIAVSHYTNLCWTGCAPGAPDVGGFIEARSVLLTRRGLVVRTRDTRDGPYVLVQVDPETNVCYFIGWEYRATVISRGEVQGVIKPYWTLPRTLLRPMPDLLDLVAQTVRGELV